MATASKKVSFKERYAQPQTKVLKAVMFNGDECELEIRKITGVQELLAARQDILAYSERVKELTDKAEASDDEGGNQDISAEDLSIIEEGNALFGKMLKRVVVGSEDGMTEDDWTTMASNLGGLQSSAWSVVSEAVGLPKTRVEAHELPLSSGASSG